MNQEGQAAPTWISTLQSPPPKHLARPHYHAHNRPQVNLTHASPNPQRVQQRQQHQNSSVTSKPDPEKCVALPPMPMSSSGILSAPRPSIIKGAAQNRSALQTSGIENDNPGLRQKHDLQLQRDIPDSPWGLEKAPGLREIDCVSQQPAAFFEAVPLPPHISISASSGREPFISRKDCENQNDPSYIPDDHSWTKQPNPTATVRRGKFYFVYVIYTKAMTNACARIPATAG